MNSSKTAVFDLETTGLYYMYQDRICEIACCIYINEVLVSTFHTYVNPERSIPARATQIHNISDEMVKNSPKFHDIAKKFLNFIDDAVIIGHNSTKFDLPFLNAELKRANYNPIKNYHFDTIVLYRQLFPKKRASLDQMCERFNINNLDRIEIGHNALLDAKLTANCFFHMKRLIE